MGDADQRRKALTEPQHWSNQKTSICVSSQHFSSLPPSFLSWHTPLSRSPALHCQSLFPAKLNKSPSHCKRLLFQPRPLKSFRNIISISLPARGSFGLKIQTGQCISVFVKSAQPRGKVGLAWMNMQVLQRSRNHIPARLGTGLVEW